MVPAYYVRSGSKFQNLLTRPEIMRNFFRAAKIGVFRNNIKHYILKFSELQRTTVIHEMGWSLKNQPRILLLSGFRKSFSIKASKDHSTFLK